MNELGYELNPVENNKNYAAIRGTGFYTASSNKFRNSFKGPCDPKNSNFNSQGARPIIKVSE